MAGRQQPLESLERHHRHWGCAGLTLIILGSVGCGVAVAHPDEVPVRGAPSQRTNDAAGAALERLGARVTFRSQLVLQQIKELGAANIIVASVKPPHESPRDGKTRVVRGGLKWSDFERVMATIPTLERAAPMREMRSQVRHKDRASEFNVVGCTPENFNISQLRLHRGRLFTDRDLKTSDSVAVIATGVSRRLFPNENPIGRPIMIGDAAFTIIGETKEREPSASAVSLILGRGNCNLDVYIPLTTMTRRIGSQVVTHNAETAQAESFELSQMTLVVEDVSKVEPTANIIARLLQKTHKTPDYSIIVPILLLKQASQLSHGARNDIVVVDLRGTRINDTELALVKNLTDIEFLLLNDTPISDAGLNHLQGLRQMRAVWLQNTKVTDMGVSKLQRALPRCLIHR